MTRNREIVLVFVVLIVGIACAASLTKQIGMSSSEAAAWAQALGTVGAIWVGMLTISQRRSELRQEQRRLSNSAKAAIARAKAGAIECSAALYDGATLRGLNTLGVGVVLGTWIAQLDEFPEHQADNAVVGYYVRHVADALRALVELADFFKRAETDPNICAGLQDRVNGVLALIDDALSELETLSPGF